MQQGGPRAMIAGATRRDLLMGTAGLAGLAVLGGCGTGSDDPATREMLLAETAHPTKREPTSAGKFYALMGIAETLVDVDAAGAPRPALAAGWTTSADGLEWRFDLRPAARFHDGSPVTAQAAAQALRRAQARPGVMGVLPVEEIAADGAQLVLRLSAPSTLVLPVLAQDSTIILAPASFDASDQAVAVIGSGPYRIANATQQEVAVERWEHWDGARPSIARARYLSAARPETRALLAESGDADAVYDLDWPSERRLRDNPELTVMDISSPRTTLLKVNASHPFLSDVRARTALSLAIDRQAIARGLFGNADRAAGQLLPPFFKDWHQRDLPPLQTDAAQARTLLAQLGWRAGADGILVRDGRRFSLTLLSHSARTDQPLITAALQDQFRRIGVEVNTLLRSPAEMVSAHEDGTLELAIFARNHMLLADPAGVMVQDYAPGGAEWGAMGWDDPAMIADLQTLVSGRDPDQAPALRARIVRTLQSELPVIPILYNSRTAAFSKRLGGVTLDPLERSYGLAAMRWTA